METIYSDIAARTGGNVYIGVVGPVRTGKSTLIKRIMEKLVIPGIEDPYRAQRAKDELPQSGSGRTIMTSEPKFVPEEAVQICPDGKTKLRLRLIDSVGYMVEGVEGATEDGAPRMVTTSWFDHPIPMAEAAQLGTKKVIQQHCTVGIVVTTDGSVTDIPRENYLEAEARAIEDMRATGKPFLVVVNTDQPGSERSGRVQDDLRRRCGVESIAADCQSLDAQGITQLLGQLLYSFPMMQLQVHLPRWMDVLEPEHPLKSRIYATVLEQAKSIDTLAQAQNLPQQLQSLEQAQEITVTGTDLSSGTVSCRIVLPRALFYGVLSDRCGIAIESDTQLLAQMVELSQAKREYDRIADALQAVRATGYGIVLPDDRDIQLEKPQTLRKGGSFGVKLQASAPSLHLIRVDVDTQLSPIVGSEDQSRELVELLSAEAPERLWESNLFGKSVGAMIREGLAGKLLSLPEDVRDKFRGTLTTVVNEGANGLICLIL